MTVAGESLVRASGKTRDQASGSASEDDPSTGSMSHVKFRTRSRGALAAGTTKTVFSSSTDASGVVRESTAVDYSVEASGQSQTAVQTTGVDRSGDDVVAYLTRTSSTAQVGVAAEGTRTNRLGPGGAESSEKGVKKQQTTLGSQTVATVTSRDSSSISFEAADEALAELNTYDDSGIDAAFERTQVNGSGRMGGTVRGIGDGVISPLGDLPDDFLGTIARVASGVQDTVVTTGAFSDGPGGSVSDGAYDSEQITFAGDKNREVQKDFGSLYATEYDGETTVGGGYSGRDSAGSGNSRSDDATRQNAREVRRGDGRMSKSQSSAEATTISQGPSASASGLSDASSQAERVTVAQGSGFDARTASDAGVTTNSTSRGSSESDGTTFLTVQSGRVAGSGASTQSVGLVGDSQGEQDGSSRSRTHGSVGESNAGGSLKGEGRSSFTALMTGSAGDLRIATGWGEQSDGEGTSDASSKRSDGVSGGQSESTQKRSGGGSDGPDGSEAWAREKTGQKSDSHSVSRTHEATASKQSRQSTTGTHEGKGSGSRSVQMEDGRVTDSSSRSDRSGKNTRTIATQDRDANTNSASSGTRTYTTKSGTRDGTFSGTDTLEVKYGDQSSSRRGGLNPETQTGTSDSEHSWMESVTHAPDRSSATTSSKSSASSSSKTEKEGWSEDNWSKSESKSGYKSSHDNGVHGAEGGSFESSSSSEYTSGITKLVSQVHGMDAGTPQALEETITGDKSVVEEKGDGSYADGPGGRTQRGTWEVSSHSETFGDSQLDRDHLNGSYSQSTSNWSDVVWSEQNGEYSPDSSSRESSSGRTYDSSSISHAVWWNRGELIEDDMRVEDHYTVTDGAIEGTREVTQTYSPDPNLRGIGSYTTEHDYATGETTCTGDPPSSVSCSPGWGSAGDGEGGADRPKKTSGGGVQAEPVQVVVEDVSPSYPGGPTQIPPAPLFPPDFFNDPRGNASEVTLGGQTRLVAELDNALYVMNLDGVGTGESVVPVIDVGSGEVVGYAFSTGEKALSFGEPPSRDLLVEAFATGYGATARTLGKAGFGGKPGKPLESVTAPKATGARPGSVSGNPANRKIAVPDKNGRLRDQYVRITPEDAQRYRNAQADRSVELLSETPANLKDEAARLWRHDQMNQFRRSWLDNFYKKRDY